MNTKLKHLLGNFKPAQIIMTKAHRKLFKNFADKVGLVYFGYVNQRSDEHRLVRGLTISPHHRDDHYCIGTYQKYDIITVERTDALSSPDRPPRNHRWIIMEFDLHTKNDLPHIFIGLQSHGQLVYSHLFTKFPHLVKMPFGSFAGYDQVFVERFAIFTEPAKILDVQQLFDPSVTKVIAEQFGHLAVEITGNNLYLYAGNQHPTEGLLERMLRCGVWLAESIDHKTDH